MARKTPQTKTTEAKDLRGKQPTELREELMKLRREQFNLRMGEAAGQPPKPDQWSKVRRSIARLKTVLGEKVQKADVKKGSA